MKLRTLLSKNVVVFIYFILIYSTQFNLKHIGVLEDSNTLESQYGKASFSSHTGKPMICILTICCLFYISLKKIRGFQLYFTTWKNEGSTWFYINLVETTTAKREYCWSLDTELVLTRSTFISKKKNQKKKIMFLKWWNDKSSDARTVSGAVILFITHCWTSAVLNFDVLKKGEDLKWLRSLIFVSQQCVLWPWLWINAFKLFNGPNVHVPAAWMLII